MELNESIKNRTAGFIEQQHMTPEQAVINQMLYRLDLERHRLELKWGCGRLQELAPPELRQKWDAQIAKLNDAIMDRNIQIVEDLIAGCVRGLAALEKSAVAAGHVPFEPLFWEVKMDDGIVYRVVRNREEIQAAEKKPPDGRTVCLEELVRVFNLRHERVFKTAPNSELVDSGRSFNEEIGF